jgi:copper resistance protein B
MVAIGLSIAAPAIAQQHDAHSMHHGASTDAAAHRQRTAESRAMAEQQASTTGAAAAPTTGSAAAEKPGTSQQGTSTGEGDGEHPDPHATTSEESHGHAGMDHASMHHGDAAGAPQANASDPHASDTHDTGHDDASPDPGTATAGTRQDAATQPPHVMHHAGMDMSASQAPHAMQHTTAGALHAAIPEVTDADRAAAFPPLSAGHASHDRMVHGFALLDRLEIRDDDAGTWGASAWIGGDIDRIWLRSEGEFANGRVEDAGTELLYGRAVSPWWNIVGGLRVDSGEGPTRTYAAIGVQGQAPYKFHTRATAYFGAHRSALGLEAEYETLLTNRLIVQWRSEADIRAGRDDPARHVGSGLSTLEAGARLRYEFTRRFAPYVGVEAERAFGDTARLRRTAGRDARDVRMVAGLRLWF